MLSFFMAEQNCIAYKWHILFIHPSLGSYSVTWLVWAVLTMSLATHVFLFDFKSLEYMLMNSIAGSNWLDQTVVHVVLCFWGISVLIPTEATVVYSPTNDGCWRIFFCLNSFQLLFLFISLKIIILTGVRWNHNVVLTCISLTTKSVE